MNVEYEVNVNFEKGEWTFQEWWNGKTTGPHTIRNMETLPQYLKAYSELGYVARAIRF